jgi:SAM-dependent methyltransferase
MSGYAMGRTASERERLDMQDRVFSPHSANLFRQAGIGPGDHVVDVGCGTGATTRLLAELVGPAGSVLGIDNDPPSLEVAEEQTRATGLSNVGYRAGDLTELVLGESFDAVAGRLVLLHLSDPATALARLARCVRPGGLIVFQEISCSRVRAVPQIPAMLDWVGWMSMLSAYAGLDADIGEHLPALFTRAGLADVNAAAVSVIGDSKGLVPRYLAETLTSVGPLAVASGAATRQQIREFRDRLLGEAADHGCVLYTQELTSVWARVEGDPDG